MNKNIIFFDTETTGNTNKDFLIQLAYKMHPSSQGKEETFVDLYKAENKIPPEASAVHHITNKMVENKKSFKDSPEYEKIKALFENENSVVVAHNAPFDLMMLEKENIKPKNFICTLRLARYLDKEEVIEQYKLQYLRYYLDIDIDAVAHDALGDVLVLEKLFERLQKKIMSQENIDEEKAIQKMMEISSHPSIFTKLNFGKHKGKKIQEVLQIDRGWLQWLLTEKEKSDVLDEDWIYTLKHYLS